METRFYYLSHAAFPSCSCSYVACVGFVVAIIRGYLKESDFESAFLEEKVDIPRAPSLGLLLDNVS